MGSAAVQGRLWSAGAGDWAELHEQNSLPLFGAALQAGLVRRGTRLLDAGCGAGLVSLLAVLRGAEVVAVDVAPAFLAIARERLPDADVREVDLDTLPFADASFDVALAVQSVFYAADMARAMGELARMVRPGGRVVATGWGPPDRCDYARISAALGPIAPPPPGAISPSALGAPGVWEGLFAGAGLQMVGCGEVNCPFIFPDAEAAWHAHASAGPFRRAIEVAGEAAVRAACAAVDRAHAQPDGSVRYENVFVWVAGERP